MSLPVDIESIQARFERIKAACPSLSFDMPPPEWKHEVSLFMGLEKQRGLAEPVTIYLADDCLNMCCSDLWLEMFPCTNKAVCDDFERQVVGFLNGKFKIVLRYRYGTYIGSNLAPADGTHDRSLYGHRWLHVETFCFWKAIEYREVLVSKR